MDNAIGPQLDQVGTIVGASRTVGFQPSDSVSPVLDDATYRILIKATAANNSWDGTIDGLQSIWKTLFPGGSIIVGDQQNMTADYLSVRHVYFHRKGFNHERIYRSEAGRRAL